MNRVDQSQASKCGTAAGYIDRYTPDVEVPQHISYAVGLEKQETSDYFKTLNLAFLSIVLALKLFITFIVGYLNT